MITKELVEFIKKSKIEGKTNEQIKITLVGNGWLPADVEEGFSATMPAAIPVPPNTPPPVLNIQKDPMVMSPSDSMIRPMVSSMKVMPKKSSTGLLVSVVAIFLLVAGGASAYVFKDNLKTLPIIKKFFPVTEVVVAPPVEVPVVATTAPVVPPPPANCDGNMDCLINAASNCQSISGVVSFSNIPIPFPEFLKGFDASGQTRYEIKSSQEANSCTLVYSALSYYLSISDVNRKKMLAEEKGSTNVQIDTQLKTMNESFKGVVGLSNTCKGSPSAIATYLSDQKNGTSSGTFSFSAKVGLNGSASTSTITTTKGQKLTCSTQQTAAKVQQ